MKRLLIIGLLVMTAASAHAAGSLKRTVLPNGLVVLAVEDRASAVAAFHLAARYDAFGVPPRKAGVAAVSQQALQHDLYELLKQDPWQELGTHLRGTRAGIMPNTEPDYCEIRGKIPYEVLPQALQAAGKLLLGQQPITDEGLQQAKAVLAAAQADSPSQVIEGTYYAFLRALHGPRSALARPVQGAAESMAAISATDVVAFRRTYTVPGNSVLTVVGPAAVDDLVDLATLAMGSYPSGEGKVPASTAPIAGRSRSCAAQQEGWRGISLMVGVPAPDYGTRDFLVAQLVYSLLEGEGGRLASDPVLRSGLGLNRIVSRESEPVSVTVLPPMPGPRPAIILHMVMSPRQMEQARLELLKHFLALQQEPPSAGELERAKQRLTNSYAQLRLDRAGFAKAVSCYEIYGADPAAAWQADAQIQAITGEDVTALANRWFGTHAIGVLMPGDD